MGEEGEDTRRSQVVESSYYNSVLMIMFIDLYMFFRRVVYFFMSCFFVTIDDVVM